MIRMDRFFVASALVTAVASAVASDAWSACPVGPGYSPAWNATFCAPGQSCAPNDFSAGGGWGCCPFPNSTACPSSYQCCPQGSSCTLISGTGYSAVYTCTGASPPTTSKCPCKPGQPLPPSTTLKNVLIIGDSLSIGFTPYVASALADVALVQHAPWDVADGGAEESAYQLQCLDNWLVSPSGVAFTPDVIYFNSGMHNLVTSGTPGDGTVPGQSGNTTVYPGEMAAIAARLSAFAAASGNRTRLIYGLTTPWLCSADTDAIITGTLNAAAAGIMRNASIPVVDTHAPIVAKCGAAPTPSCFGLAGCWCPHCPPGYSWLADTVIAPAIRAVLMDSE